MKLTAVADSTADLPVARLIHEATDQTRVPRLWSAKAIASHWNMSRMHVYRAHRVGRLKGYRVLGTLRFLEDDVLGLLRAEGLPVEGSGR